MTTVIVILFIAFLLSPFFGLGIWRAWRTGAAIWGCLVVFLAYYYPWSAPAGFDEQDVMGHDAFLLLLLIVAIGAVAAFAAGFAVSIMRERSLQTNLKEGIE